MEAHLGLTFPHEYRRDLVALVEAKARRARKAIDRKKARAEADRVAKSAKQLTIAIRGDGDFPNWAGALHMECLLEGGTHAGESGVVGAEICGPEWGDEIVRLLDRFAQAAERVHASLGTEDGTPAESYQEMFAETLAAHFVRAGGNPGAPGKPGFPAFLKLVWELVPADQRPEKAESFADALKRPVSEGLRLRRDLTAEVQVLLKEMAKSKDPDALVASDQDVKNLEEATAKARANYRIQQSKAYWGIPL